MLSNTAPAPPVGIGNKVVSRPIAVVAVVIGAVAGLESTVDEDYHMGR